MWWNKKRDATDELLDLVEDKIKNDMANWDYRVDQKAFAYKNNVIFLYERASVYGGERGCFIDINDKNGGTLVVSEQQKTRVTSLLRNLHALIGIRNILKSQ